MWGGWYHDKAIMNEIREMKEIVQNTINKKVDLFPRAETVMFIDEEAYLNNPRDSFLCHSVNVTRVAMGNTGIPFDLCMVEDAEKVLSKYRAAIFTAPIPSESGAKAISLCNELHIPSICTSTEKTFFSEKELRDFLLKHKIHCYNDEGCVIYCGGGFLGVHSISDRTVKISLPHKYKIRPLFADGLTESETDTLHLNMKKHDTFIWELY